jgi:ABC-type oligopeptide transport system substrate-binding subunit
MRKFLFSALCISALSAACLVSTGCGSEVRTVPTVAGEHKQSFKSAIQNNPNIPDAQKKAFK